ncbi:hypothetical protein G6F43_004700 [Rhizopus delemar]|nr:hypothetical protein G6F43_004700 [Rhizopus delemar]
MDFTKNYIFLDESAFRVNMKRSMVWSKKGSSVAVKVLKVRAQTTMSLGSISASGLNKCIVRLPQPPAKNKRGSEVMTSYV